MALYITVCLYNRNTHSSVEKRKKTQKDIVYDLYFGLEMKEELPFETHNCHSLLDTVDRAGSLPKAPSTILRVSKQQLHSLGIECKIVKDSKFRILV